MAAKEMYISFRWWIPYFLNSQIISAVATNASRHTALQCRREAFLVKGSPCFHTRHHSPRPSAGDHRQAMPCQQPERHKTQRFLSKAPLPLLFTTELPKLTASQSQRNSTPSTHWKGWCWNWSSNTLSMWCEELTHWKNPDAGKTEGRRRRGWQRMRWLDGLTDSGNMNLAKLWETVRDSEAWHAAVHSVTKSCTLLGHWTTTDPVISLWSYTNI